MKHSTEPCRCECGYRCGGPGRCELDVFECLERDDGKHFVRDCDHDFSGPMKEFRDSVTGCSGGSVHCQKCDMSAMAHDEINGP